ncbi:hypothetical protein L596_019387 [Steinernema carpocapsae]|uniref:Uncharacterized protein n=1 Tax=Steinernema carpocapsae TaxID=34508 RepID=A0A4U5MQI2_STECR|nr:hypothetical protein L596_019387 [Steinernema carpocapsae]
MKSEAELPAVFVTFSIIYALVFGFAVTIACAKKKKEKRGRGRKKPKKVVALEAHPSPAQKSFGTPQPGEVIKPSSSNSQKTTEKAGERNKEDEMKMLQSAEAVSLNPFEKNEKTTGDGQRKDVLEDPTQRSWMPTQEVLKKTPEKETKNKDRRSVRSILGSPTKNQPISMNKNCSATHTRRNEDSIGMPTVRAVDEETQRTASVQVNDSEDTNELVPDLKPDDILSGSNKD